MTRSTFLAIIRRTVRDWLAYREARQRQQRFARLCRVAPELSVAHDALLGDRRHHRSTKDDIAAMRRAMSERLQRRCAMADRPILFSGPMVRALLAGSKTQTRRIINPQPKVNSHGSLQYERPGVVLQGTPETLALHGLRIVKGDRLYVREHWRINKVWDAVAPRDLGDIGPITYVADNGMRYFTGKFRQGMHMPKRFSRITLLVTAARVQRLQDISRADAMAEGITEGPDGLFRGAADHLGQASPQAAYGDLWEAINGAGTWDANPWVAAYTFEVERCNIAQARAA